MRGDGEVFSPHIKGQKWLLSHVHSVRNQRGMQNEGTGRAYHPFFVAPLPASMSREHEIGLNRGMGVQRIEQIWPKQDNPDDNRVTWHIAAGADQLARGIIQ